MRVVAFAVLSIVVGVACKQSKTADDVDCALDPNCAPRLRTSPSSDVAPSSGATSGASGASTGTSSAPAADAADIAVTATSFALKGKTFPKKPKLGDFARVLGKPSRVVNQLQVFDDEGIVLYMGEDGERVNTVSIFFGEFPSYAFMPKKVFSGTISLGGKKYTPEMSTSAFDYAVAKRVSAGWADGKPDVAGYLQINF
jgi:hypothetical protein